MNDQTSPEKAAMKDSGVQIRGAAGLVESQSSDWWDRQIVGNQSRPEGATAAGGQTMKYDTVVTFTL